MQQLISSDPTTPAVCIDTPLVILNGMVCMQIENFKLCLFYNNNTWLQIGHKVILLGGESIRNIFVQGKLSEFLPWIKISNPTHAGCEIQSHDLPVTQWWCYHLVQSTTLTTLHPGEITDETLLECTRYKLLKSKIVNTFQGRTPVLQFFPNPKIVSSSSKQPFKGHHVLKHTIPGSVL